MSLRLEITLQPLMQSHLNEVEPWFDDPRTGIAFVVAPARRTVKAAGFEVASQPDEQAMLRIVRIRGA